MMTSHKLSLFVFGSHEKGDTEVVQGLHGGLSERAAKEGGMYGQQWRRSLGFLSQIFHTKLYRSIMAGVWVGGEGHQTSTVTSLPI